MAANMCPRWAKIIQWIVYGWILRQLHGDHTALHRWFSPSAFISHFHNLMVLTSTYMWSAVCAFHHKVLGSIKMGLASWGDSFNSLKQPFFLPTALLTDSTNKTRGHHQAQCLALLFPAVKSARPGLGTITAKPMSAHFHVCIVCKRNHHAKTCSKRKYPVPPHRQDPTPQTWLHA